MPALLDDNTLSNTSLLDLLAQVKSEITDISGRMLMLVQHLCRDENETFLKIQLDVPGFKELQNLKTALREYAEQGVTNPIELAQKIFQGGLFSQYDQFAGHLKKTYKRVLHGLILDEKILFQCLDDIINFNHRILTLGTSKADTFQGTFVAWTRELLTLPSHVAVPESLRIPFSEHRANLNNITMVATNLDKVLLEILGRLTKTLCIQLLNNAHQHNVIENSVPDAKTLPEVLAQHPLTTETYSQLLKRIANTNALLWSFEESYRNEYRSFLTEKTLHPEVYRLHYYNQGWNPSIKIVVGLCAGGIRFWSCLPHSTIQPIPLQIDKPTFQHMSWVDNQALYHYQLNQTGFDTVKNSGDHFIFSLCTVEEKFIVKGKPSSMSERYPGCRAPRETFWDIRVTKMYSEARRLYLCRGHPRQKVAETATFFSDDSTPHFVFPSGLCGYRGLADFAFTYRFGSPCLLRSFD